MIKIIDFGCHEHNWRQINLIEPDAELVKDCIYNLPREGKYHTYVCSLGHTHRIREFKMPYVVPAPIFEIANSAVS